MLRTIIAISLAGLCVAADAKPKSSGEPATTLDAIAAEIDAEMLASAKRIHAIHLRIAAADVRDPGPTLPTDTVAEAERKARIRDKLHTWNQYLATVKSAGDQISHGISRAAYGGASDERHRLEDIIKMLRQDQKAFGPSGIRPR